MSESENLDPQQPPRPDLPPGADQPQPEMPPPADHEDHPLSPEEEGTLTLQQERDELYERLLRVSADYQNSMKRVQQNLVDEIDRARADLLRQLVPVLDHFDTAIAAQPQSDEAARLYDGVRIVRDELLKTLRHAGVERLEPQVGQPFDPHLHEAMMRQEADDVPPNHIAAAFQPGYLYKGRTLRPAKVAVAP